MALGNQPSATPTSAPTVAAEICWMKPSSDEAAPARSGNGYSARIMVSANSGPTPKVKTM